LRFLIEIVDAIRVNARPTFAIGLRITMDERIDGGYGIVGAVEMAKLMEEHGIDYVHGVVGSPWGNPGYIPPNHWPEGAFASLAGQIKEAVKIPVVYAGRVTTPAVAEAILEAGQADVIGVARALLSDAEFVSKAREGRDDEIRRCIGCNECIHRVQAEAIVFSCSVNPGAGREHLGPPVVSTSHERPLVVGGGPAGLAFAVRAAELGLDVSLWERSEQLGGQMLIAARGPGQADLLWYIDHQSRRLAELGVDIRLGHLASSEEILGAGFDAVVVATGSTSRTPPIDGLAEATAVHDVRRVMMGEHVDGDSVVIVSQDDHLAPLSVAEVLAVAGKKVHIICQTNGPSPLLGRHTLGTVLARLSHLGITWTFMEQVVGLQAGVAYTKNVYSGQPGSPIRFDSLVLACGSESDSRLADSLRDEVERLYVIGDAFAPRRISFATKQGYLLAERLAMELSSGIIGNAGGRPMGGRDG
jgi:NADPH-dependent 2,4-dienoyl-CoA reductase/sulfur reductase-like enzyme